jgi:hypothetical protein
MSVHSIQPPDGPADDKETLIIHEWKFNYGDAMLGIWGIAKALEEELVTPRDDTEEEVAQCLAIALVNLATQLKKSH